MYDDDTIKILESMGFADAASNVELGNKIVLLSLEGQFKKAESMLQGITIPTIRKDLEHIIEVNRTCTCIRQ